MTEKVTQLRSDDSALVGAAKVPNKMIAGGASMLEKLASALSTVMAEREKNLLAVSAATAILDEPPPPGFDNEAAGRSVAQARVDDLMKDTSTADAVAADFDKARTAAKEATARHDRRQAEAQQNLEEANSFVQALTAQALQVDAALRKEIAAHAAEKQFAATEAFYRAAAHYFDAYINYRATLWLKGVEDRGSMGKLFCLPEEMDFLFAIPSEYRAEFPEEAIASMTPGVINCKAWLTKGLVRDRGIEMMGSLTKGGYPDISASLTSVVVP